MCRGGRRSRTRRAPSARGDTRRAARRGRRASPRLDGCLRRGSRGERWHAVAIVCAHAATDQPRRAVPGAGELAPDGPRGQPRDARRVDGPERGVRDRTGQAAALRARAAAAAAALAAGRGAARARSSLLGRGGRDRPRLPRARDGAGDAGHRRAAGRPGRADHVAAAGSRAAAVGALRDRGPRVRPRRACSRRSTTRSSTASPAPRSWRCCSTSRPRAARRRRPPTTTSPTRRPPACRCSRSGCSASPATRCGCCARCRRRSRTSRTRRSGSSPAPARSRRWPGCSTATASSGRTWSRPRPSSTAASRRTGASSSASCR